MEPFGIYTLANDAVYDQFIALINSIEANIGPDILICVIPFDDRLDRIRDEIKTRPNVQLFDDRAAIDRWETFACQVTQAHPEATPHPRWYGGKLHRKFVAFDGPFETFIFFDGDSLAMKPVTEVIAKLQDYDVVFDDWEHAKPKEFAALDIQKIEVALGMTETDIRGQLHCSSFFGSHRGLFDPATLADLHQKLVHQGEANWIGGHGWWDDAFLFNYMTLRSNCSLFNMTLSPDVSHRTGNCANADQFVTIDHVLYNHQGLKPIHRIHYMGYSSTDFGRLCQGEDVNIRFKDIFLHYRFLKQPEAKPLQLKKPDFWTKINRFSQRNLSKIKSYSTV
jgi:hypothetical protein